MAEMHRYECHLQTGDRLITLTVYADKELTPEEVKQQAIDEAEQALSQYAKEDFAKELVKNLEFISYKYLGDYSGFE